ncbi:hypothetical protein RE9431_17260 [Prescottella equi]|nr:hypothetical protein RE9431_17260 [Prescottella equi]BCN73123.1 hypothetical protein RE0327_17220 [Prescottella equi]
MPATDLLSRVVAILRCDVTVVGEGVGVDACRRGGPRDRAADRPRPRGSRATDSAADRTPRPTGLSRHPDQQEPGIFSPDLSIPFYTKNGIERRLDRVHVYAAGVSFQLFARVPDQLPDQNGPPTGSEAMNLSSRKDRANPTEFD